MMAYALKIKKKARKALEKAPEHIRKKLDDEFEKACQKPRNNKPMEGLEDTYRIRAGDWRAIYEVSDEEITVTVVKIGSRGDIYK